MPVQTTQVLAGRLTKATASALVGAVIVPLSSSVSLAAEPLSEQARIAAAVEPASDFSKAERYERRPGGAATVFEEVSRDSFSHPSANMALHANSISGSATAFFARSGYRRPPLPGHRTGWDRCSTQDRANAVI